MTTSVLQSGLTAHELRYHLDNLRATKPPYNCPIRNCDRVYKSFSGIQTHLSKVRHDTSGAGGGGIGGDQDDDAGGSSAVAHPDSRNDDAGGGGSLGVGQAGRSGGGQMSWTQAQKIIDVEVASKIVRLNILEPIPLSFCQGGGSTKNDEKKPTEMVPVPKAVFKDLSEFEPTDMDTFPSTYIRYIEKTAEELDEEIEYDMDEEDEAWLERINETRLREGWPRVSEATFEYVMNRFEKDSYFKMTAGIGTSGGGGDGGAGGGDAVTGSGGRIPHYEQDDDTVCCVCGDGECDNSNAILFCDMCNLAVHQECYGVPYIPEGQWLCRRCQLSPSRGVDCRLCPNKGGAFKQTSDNGWSHVICALWVPEVQFANTVFLEPIEGFDRIPPARWKLTCYICKQKSRGACIQCHKPSCYTAFHVTCAQQAGLHMKMEPVPDARSPDGGISVRKSAFCDAHTPDGAESADEKPKKQGQESERKHRTSDSTSGTPKFDMRKARKLLSQKRNLAPTVSEPVMPRRRLDLLLQQLRFAGKQEFLERILRYWTLKRRQRFGVPLLRRLQVTHHASRMEKERVRNRELQDQYNNWRQLRQDLEKARLLMELVRKRERKKKDDVQAAGESWESLLWEPQRRIIAAIDQLDAIDERRVFTQPVDESEVPGYTRIIKNPMDLSTMRTKAEQFEYKDFAQMEKDFELMMTNCMRFNVQNEYYKSYGTKYKKEALEILRQASQAYVQLKEDLPNLLTETQGFTFRGEFSVPLVDAEEVDDGPSTSNATDTSPQPKKQKPATTPKPKKTQVAIKAMDDAPVLSPIASSVASVASSKEKKGTRTSQPKTPSSSKVQKLDSDAPIPSALSPGTTPKATPSKKKANATTTASSAKKSAAKDKKMPVTPATPQRQPKKPKQQSTAGTSTRKKKSADDEEDDVRPLALLGQATPKLRGGGGDADKFVSPSGEPAKPSFVMFREDRRSPNSSAVESEMEPASGDEGGFLRKKSALPSTSHTTMDAVGVSQVQIEHLDFVWARVDGKPWMPGVVIFPDVKFGPQAPISYTPPPEVLNQEVDDAFLVMLFDDNKSWVWLKRDALAMLGLEHEKDRKLMHDGTGPTRSIVIDAYGRALKARQLVITGGSTDDGDESGPPIIDEYRASSGSDSSASKRRTTRARVQSRSHSESSG